ncbi:MAG: PIG-L family deacetylase [Oscillospiraceae bacterium]|nr:PIG-L family deacetylase [Oscillospiraceae bacterium]
MGITSAILCLAAPPPRLMRFRRYLFVGPHPDDIEIGAGATAARLCSEGKEVTFLICTDGRYGLENAPAGTVPEDLIALRKKESIEGAAMLGVTDVRFLGLSDGGLYSREELVERMAAIIGDAKPDVVFAPDPFVSSECHADHLAVGEAARSLAFFAPFAEIMERYGAKSSPVEALAFYMTAKPNRFIKTSSFFSRQLDAVLCHQSQFPEDSEAYASLKLYLNLRSVDFGLRCFSLGAEGFRVLGRTQMHCLPEAR